MDSIKILISDDESRIRKLVKDFLIREGYVVFEAENGKEALDVFLDTPDLKLIILDIMMPFLDGYQVLKEIRKTSDIPVIMLTAKSSEEDELKGFDLGVDEYISKPFSPKILMARVSAVIRRSEENPAGSDTILVAGDINVDVSAHVAKVNNKEIVLSVKEFELLTYFIQNQGMALSRDMILNNVWNYDYYGDARTIDTHVKKLRSKLGECGNYIKTIWGMGYKFEVV